MFSLKTAITTSLIALTVAGTTLATTSQAEARNRFLPGLAAGFIGGALVADALQPHYYAPPVYRPVYRPYVVVNNYPVCHVVWRQNAWGDQYRARVCH
nr:hypothetical protein [uncultured Shinella sp.]